MNAARKCMIGFLTLVLWAGLAGYGHAQSPMSGFLGDYSQFKPSGEIKGALVYEHPTKTLRDYNKFIVEPIAVHFAPGAEGVTIDPAKLFELVQYFHGQAVKALRKKYQVVNNSGPGVLRIRAAITGIEKSIPLLNIHPGTKVTGIGLGGASMEAEAVDSVTGGRILAIVDSQRGKRLSFFAGLSEFGHAKQVMDMWVERFMKRLDAAHATNQ